jgi:hypothetical protein
MRRSDLEISQILAWADAHHRKTGQWPRRNSGFVAEALEATWLGIDVALQHGNRGLPGGASLAQLLAEQRGVRNRMRLPRFTEQQILGWMDAHFTRFGVWPHGQSGAIPEAPGETWKVVDMALRSGCRGLPGGTSLVRLQARCRQVTRLVFRPLRVDQILVWADAHHERTGRWPTSTSGAIAEAPEETWAAVQTALRCGYRGLPGPSSLAKLLVEYRSKRNYGALPHLTYEQILAWADQFHRQWGKCPSTRDGAVAAAPGETWAGINIALKIGGRGLTAGLSLSRLIKKHRPVFNRPGQLSGFNPFARPKGRAQAKNSSDR